jgi:hypothetical protein
LEQKFHRRAGVIGATHIVTREPKEDQALADVGLTNQGQRLRRSYRNLRFLQEVGHLHFFHHGAHIVVQAILNF